MIQLSQILSSLLELGGLRSKPLIRTLLVVLGLRHLRCAIMATSFLTDMPAIKVLPFFLLCHVDDRSFATIGLHGANAASDWLMVKRRCCTA
jgi:hypothetical protein